MNRKSRLVIALTTGVLAVGAVAAPALAGVGPFARPNIAASAGPRVGAGFGAGPQSGPGAGVGPSVSCDATGLGLRGDGICAVTAPSGTLTDAQKGTLAAMAEEEKLAGDLYQNFADKYPAVVFDRIAAAEDQHLTAVRTLLTRYAISDPTAGKPAGQFTSTSVQATYDQMLAQGQADQTAALAVGQQVEQTDITDLGKALDGLTAADVTQVYRTLLSASQQHLEAFTTWATR